MVRTFICVEITDQEIITVLNNYIKELKKIKGVRTIKSSQLHLTLKFLGEISEKQLISVQGLMKQIHSPPFEITLKELGCFPNIKRIKVLWVGVSNGNEDLRKLATIIEQSLKTIGFPRDKRPYSPHLTLARVKYLKNDDKISLGQKIQDSKEIIIGNQFIDKVILKKSTLTPTGAIYENLLTVPLSN